MKSLATVAIIMILFSLAAGMEAEFESWLFVTSSEFRSHVGAVSSCVKWGSQ